MNECVNKCALIVCRASEGEGREVLLRSRPRCCAAAAAAAGAERTRAVADAAGRAGDARTGVPAHQLPCRAHRPPEPGLQQVCDLAEVTLPLLLTLLLKWASWSIHSDQAMSPLSKVTSPSSSPADTYICLLGRSPRSPNACHERALAASTIYLVLAAPFGGVSGVKCPKQALSLLNLGLVFL